MKFCNNSKKSAPKLGVEAHFQPQNRLSKIKGEWVGIWPKVRLEKTGELQVTIAAKIIWAMLTLRPVLKNRSQKVDRIRLAERLVYGRKY